MLKPSDPLRFAISYTARRTLRKFANLITAGFATQRLDRNLPILLLTQSTPVARKLKGVSPHLFENKRKNLEIALSQVDGILIRPNEVFSFWQLIGDPTAKRGFRAGLTILQGRAAEGIGGGLCQLSNMMHWLALHSDLTVSERHRHSFDVFPDESRDTPFGTGATVVHNYKDLRLRNNTNNTYQFRFELTSENLVGEIRCEQPPSWMYRVVEKGAAFLQTPSGLFRKNLVWKQTLNTDGCVVLEAHLFSNLCKCSYTLEEIT